MRHTLSRLSPKGVERWAMALIALLVALISIWFGGGLLDRSQETRLVKEVLFEWERLGRSFSARGGAWPVFEGSHHVAYMRELLARMGRQGLISPHKVRTLSFAPRLRRAGRSDETLFILLLPGRMVIFGLSAQTFDRIDRQVDGASDPGRGDFTSRQASDGNQMIGYWQL